MTYGHAVKVNGKWYGAGDEVGASLPVSVTVEEPKISKVVEEKPQKAAPATKRSSNKKGSK